MAASALGKLGDPNADPRQAEVRRSPFMPGRSGGRPAIRSPIRCSTRYYAGARHRRRARSAGASNMRGNGLGEHEDAERRTAALMGFIVILVLAIAGVVLVRELGKKAALEDCLMAGRRNCAPIEVPLRQP
jgi:hypothetical protein